MPLHGRLQRPSQQLLQRHGDGWRGFLSPPDLPLLAPVCYSYIEGVSRMMPLCCSLQRPSPELLQRHRGGARGFLSPPDLPLFATARDAVAYDFTGKYNRDTATHVAAPYGYTEVCCSSGKSIHLHLIRFLEATDTGRRILRRLMLRRGSLVPHL